MVLKMKAYSPIANKLLVALSGISRNTKNPDGTYSYEKHDMHISDAFDSMSWSATRIKQLLLYISLCDSTGVVLYVSEEELAEKIGCSIRTIKLNNQLLSEKGIITWSRVHSGSISVSFTNYLEDIMDLKENPYGSTDGLETESTRGKKFDFNSGYTVLSKTIFNELLTLDDVNALRISLRMYKNVEINLTLQDKEEFYLSYSEIKGILPGYIGYKSAIKKICSKVGHLFDLHLVDNAKKMQAFVSEKNNAPELIKKAKDLFLYSVKLGKDKISKKVKEAEESRIYGVLFDLRKHIQDSVHFNNSTFGLDQLEITALVTSFGGAVIEKAFNEVKTAFDSCFYDIRSKNEIVEYFNENNSKCLRRLAENLID